MKGLLFGWGLFSKYFLFFIDFCGQLLDFYQLYIVFSNLLFTRLFKSNEILGKVLSLLFRDVHSSICFKYTSYTVLFYAKVCNRQQTLSVTDRNPVGSDDDIHVQLNIYIILEIMVMEMYGI